MFEGVGASRRICLAAYSGTPQITLTLYDMPGGPAATAFDAFQRWRTQPSRMGSFQGAIFGVAEAPEADKAVLDRFVTALEAALPPGNEARRQRDKQSCPRATQGVKNGRRRCLLLTNC